MFDISGKLGVFNTWVQVMFGQVMCLLMMIGSSWVDEVNSTWFL